MNMQMNPMVGSGGRFEIGPHFSFIGGNPVNIPDTYGITRANNGCKIMGFMYIVHNDGQIRLTSV
jgi:hypothetical protein